MKQRLWRWAGNIVLALGVLVTAFPFFVMLSVSLQSMNEIYSGELIMIPKTWHPRSF